jgi:hypothetical protein
MKKFKVTMTRVLETEIFVDAKNLEEVHKALEDKSHKDFYDISDVIYEVEMEQMNVSEQSFTVQESDETEIRFNDYTIE